MRQTDTISETTNQASAAVGDVMQVMNDVVQQASSSIGGFLPSLLGAVVILIGGFFIAKIISWIVGSVFKKTGLGTKVASLTGQQGAAADKGVGKGAAKITFYTIMAFVGLAVLKVLNLDAISGPLTGLLDDFFAFIPSAVGALIVLAIFGLVAKIVGGLVKQALCRVGFDTIIAGYLHDFDTVVTDYTHNNQSDGKYCCYAGKIVSGIILLTGFTQAVDILGLEILSNIVSQVWAFSTPLLIGVAIIAAGTIGAGKLSALVETLVPGKDGEVMAPLVKFGTIGLVSVVGLRQTGLVNNLIDTIVPIVVGGFVLALVARYAFNGPESFTELTKLLPGGEDVSTEPNPATPEGEQSILPDSGE